jgi:hypothetical protein
MIGKMVQALEVLIIWAVWVAVATIIYVTW